MTKTPLRKESKANPEITAPCLAMKTIPELHLLLYPKDPTKHVMPLKEITVLQRSLAEKKKV
jgi:hypothetical protein